MLLDEVPGVSEGSAPWIFYDNSMNAKGVIFIIFK